MGLGLGIGLGIGPGLGFGSGLGLGVGVTARGGRQRGVEERHRGTLVPGVELPPG